jgi:carbon monoxide dehydrogenase subunit G
VFVSDEVSLNAGFAAARARLATLIRGGLLERASAQAYSGEITGLVRIGPLGPVPGLSKVVRVRVRDLDAVGDSGRFALRWEVAGPGGGLFPALDADITLTPAGEHSTTLTLAGVYRPPLAGVGGALDQAVMRRVARATIRAFLAQIAEAIAYPAGPAELETADPDPPPRPAGPDAP